MLAFRNCIQESVLSSLETKKPLKGFKRRKGCIRPVLCRGHCGCPVQREKEGPAGRLASSCGWEMLRCSGTGNEGSCKDLNDGV